MIYENSNFLHGSTLRYFRFRACATAKMDKELAKQIRSDERLKIVSAKAEELIQNGLNAGDSYNEIWIRDLNTFIELACKVSDTAKYGSPTHLLQIPGTRRKYRRRLCPQRKSTYFV